MACEKKDLQRSLTIFASQVIGDYGQNAKANVVFLSMAWELSCLDVDLLWSEKK
jgi:hypothetical protein